MLEHYGIVLVLVEEVLWLLELFCCGGGLNDG